jgi:hypothetical protein
LVLPSETPKFVNSFDTQASLYSIGLILLFFVIYQLLAESPLLPQLAGWPRTQNAKVLFARLLGFVLLGLTAWLVEAKDSSSGITNLVTPEFTGAVYWILAGLALIFVINGIVAKPGETNHYPQLRYDSWGVAHVLLNTVTWMMYLFSYEWLLRGPLLDELVSVTGVYAGVAINTIIYSLIHIVKGRKEMIASIPVGIILCSITLYMGSFLAAFIFHVVFALTYEYTTLYRLSTPRYRSAQQ